MRGIPALPEKLQPIIDRRLPNVPKPYQSLYLKVLNGNGTPSEREKVMCMDCVGWERESVTLCTRYACPLYPYRPYQPVENEEGAE